jgi:hypothetical protein
MVIILFHRICVTYNVRYTTADGFISEIMLATVCVTAREYCPSMYFSIMGMGRENELDRWLLVGLKSSSLVS